MDSETEYKIRRRAYELWELAGSPAGKHLDYWLEAEKEFTGGTSSVAGDEAEEALDEGLEESFPASDPPSSTMRSGRG